MAGKAVNNGATARCFAQYMRIHALEATGGLVYAEMAESLDKSGKPTSDEDRGGDRSGHQEAGSERGPQHMGHRDRSRHRADTSYFAENVALFSMVMGAALLLTGIGFLVVTLGLLGTAARKEEEVASPEPTASPAVAV